jgi:surface protein
MADMFEDAFAFNQPINNWNTNNVEYMSYMFDRAYAFNQPINNWKTGNVKYMNSMFDYDTSFNQPLNSWNTDSVINMQQMFQNAKVFNQSLGSWNLSSIVETNVTPTLASGLDYMLDSSGLDCINYSSTLIGWADSLGTTTPSGLTLGADSLTYGTNAVDARNALLAAGWTINDGGEDEGVCEPLPITLQSFTVQAQNNNTALLQWTTATESNNKGFVVQHSTDGIDFTTLDFVNSKAAGGNSSAQLNYNYTDTHPLNGVNYYRLQQTDLDGTVKYSDVRSVQFSDLLSVYPNPVQSVLTVTGVSSEATYTLLSANGTTVMQGTLLASNKNQISVSGVADGIYFLRIVINGAVNTFKISVEK